MKQSFLGCSVSIITKALAIVGLLAVLRAGCAYTDERDEGESILEDLAIPNTPWIIQNRMMGHPSPLTGAGWLEVIAKNTATGKKAIILSLGEVQTPIKETLAGPNRVVITLPNQVDILEQHDSFSDIAIVYDYTPKNDPEERAGYHFWFHHPQDAKAIEWCMKNIVNKDFCKQ